MMVFFIFFTQRLIFYSRIRRFELILSASETDVLPITLYPYTTHRRRHKDPLVYNRDYPLYLVSLDLTLIVHYQVAYEFHS